MYIFSASSTGINSSSVWNSPILSEAKRFLKDSRASMKHHMQAFAGICRNLQAYIIYIYQKPGHRTEGIGPKSDTSAPKAAAPEAFQASHKLIALLLSIIEHLQLRHMPHSQSLEAKAPLPGLSKA